MFGLQSKNLFKVEHLRLDTAKQVNDFQANKISAFIYNFNAAKFYHFLKEF